MLLVMRSPRPTPGSGGDQLSTEVIVILGAKAIRPAGISWNYSAALQYAGATVVTPLYCRHFDQL